MQKRIKQLISLGVAAGSALLLPFVAGAAFTNTDQFGLTGPNSVANGVPNLGTADIRITIGKIINTLMGLLGTVAVVIILIGGFMWMTAGGNEEKVGKAKQLLIGGVIGLVIILSSMAITKFVLEQLITATG